MSRENIFCNNRILCYFAKIRKAGLFLSASLELRGKCKSTNDDETIIPDTYLPDDTVCTFHMEK